MELLEREDFLGTLAEYAREARHGNGRLVFVAGESGIGKTALLVEFQRETDGVRCRNPDGGAKFNFWHPDLFTMHVWIWYPNPAGLCSGTNPLVAPFNGN